jgi:hypothetical protein
MFGRAAVVVAFVFCALGCGSERPAEGPTQPPSGGTSAAPTLAPPDMSCTRVGQTEEGPLRLCADRGPGGYGTFVVGEGEDAEELEIQPPGPTPSASDAGRVGHWDWAVLSPDGSTLLAQWSAECEVPIAFFVSLPAGSPRPVTGEADWAQSPDSEALGWTRDGRAIIFLPQGPACGSGSQAAGVYLYSAPGVGERVIATHGHAIPPVPRSSRPRAARALGSGS